MLDLSQVTDAWRRTTLAVAREPAAFTGPAKETKVLRKLRDELERVSPGARIIGPDSQQRFGTWKIDLVITTAKGRVAIEGKFKTLRDGAVPDNRTAAFLDLYRLDRYVASGEYSAGLFLWLTDNRTYLRPAAGESADYSTHDGRRYRRGTKLPQVRARNKMPAPFVLESDLHFAWEVVDAVDGWYQLAIQLPSEAA